MMYTIVLAIALVIILAIILAIAGFAVAAQAHTVTLIVDSLTDLGAV